MSDMAESDMRPGNRLFRAVLDSMHERLVVLDCRGVVLFRNRAWLETGNSDGMPPFFTCAEGDDFLESWRAGMPNDDSPLAAFRAGVRSVIDGARERSETEFSLRNESGIVWYRGTAALLPREQGGALVRVEELAERKPVAELLHRLSTAVGRSPECIVITDPEGNIEYVNSGFEELTGYSFAEVRGKNPRMLQSGLTPRSTYDEMWTALKAGQIWRGLFRNRRKNGELYWEETVVAPIRSAEGSVAHYVAAMENIREENELQEALVEENACVEQADRLMERFMARVSRDGRAPFTGIAGYPGLMHFESTARWPEERCRRLRCLRESSDRLLRTIENILRLSALESGAEKLVKKTINVSRRLACLVASMSETALLKKISLQLENEAGEAYVLADEHTLNDAFRNLLDNAVECTAMGKIVVTVRRENGNIIIRVEDTGYSGNNRGLGLALAHRCIESNGGIISLSSRTDRGDTFLVTLPEVQYANEGAVSVMTKVEAR